MFATWQLIRERGLDWFNFTWFVIIHALAVLAFFFFSWSAVVVFLVLHFATGGVGICVGYHRLLTHQSFQTYKPVRLFLAWLGTLSGQGSATNWTAEHHKHHQYSDTSDDPHSPRYSFFWGHMGWLLVRRSREEKRALWRQYAKRLGRDRALRRVERFYSWMGHLSLSVLLLFGGAWWWQDVSMGVSLFLWGMAVRMAAIFHCTWLVNSMSHRWGYRTYDTEDKSYNNPIVALLSYGEGWHNNHHAFPRSARHGHKWWEFDPSYLFILGLKRLHLAWNIQEPKPHAG